MGVKSVETLGSKIRVSSVLDTFSSLSPEIMLIFLFPRLHRPKHLHIYIYSIFSKNSVKLMFVRG